MRRDSGCPPRQRRPVQIVVVVQGSGEGLPIVAGTAAGVEKRIPKIIFPPVDDLTVRGIFFALVMRKQFHRRPPSIGDYHKMQKQGHTETRLFAL